MKIRTSSTQFVFMKVEVTSIIGGWGVRSKWNRVHRLGKRFVSFVRASGRGEAAWAGDRNDPSVSRAKPRQLFFLTCVLRCSAVARRCHKKRNIFQMNRAANWEYVVAVFDNETQSFWVAPRPKDKSGVVCDELSDTDEKIRRIQIQGNRQLGEVERSQCDVSRGK